MFGGGLMGDFDDDLFGSPMNAMGMQMRSMNRFMNSLMADPFSMMPFDNGFPQNALMERVPHPHHAGNHMMPTGLFGFPAMPNMNRLLNADIGANAGGGGNYFSSSVMTMSSGPDGRPKIYQATTTSKSGPNGVRETCSTVQDSTKGIKKMAIGHHIGERAHIIEKEQDLRSGQLEERQEFINLEEEQADDFNREFTTRSRFGSGHGRHGRQVLSIEPADDEDEERIRARHHNNHHGGSSRHRRQMPALPAPEQPQASIHHHPYQSSTARRVHRPKHAPKLHQQQHQTVITELPDTDDEAEAGSTAAAPAPVAGANAAKSQSRKH